MASSDGGDTGDAGDTDGGGTTGLDNRSRPIAKTNTARDTAPITAANTSVLRRSWTGGAFESETNRWSSIRGRVYGSFAEQ